jgi:CubicO group peptidase (beta-lactamase class C family)
LVGAGILLASCALSGTTGDALDRAIEEEMGRQQVPGLSLAVVREGRIVRLGAYGYGNLEWKSRTTPHTRFEIASVTKMFTGAAVRLLVEEGRLNLEAPVNQYFDGLPESWRGMKVRHLLTMSTGLPEDWGDAPIPYGADVTTPYDDATMVRTFTGLKPVAPVGSEWHYSSPGYHMLGLIVAKVSGQALPRFMEERIFKPAGMDRSSFVENAAVVPEGAEGYRWADGTIRKGWYLGQYLHARADVGILATAEDIARWIIALRQGLIVKDPAVLWDFPYSDTGRPLDYAYGWLGSTLLGHRLVGHGGRFRTGFRSVVWVLPEDDLAVVVLTNGDW